MLTFSAQHRIINDLALSFQKNEKIHTKISDTILNRDLQFLNPKKYQGYTESNFKFIVLWTVFRNNTNKIDTLKLVNSYDKDQIREIMKEKENILYYEKTIQRDIEAMNPVTKNTENVFNMYKKGKISLMFLYRYFNKDFANLFANLSRIQKRQLTRVNFFMSFFPKIEEILKD